MLKEFASDTQVYLVTGYTDLRRGIDGLAEIVQGKLSLDPYSTALFLFLADLPVEEVFHEVEDKTCDKCGSEMTVIGREKIRDELVYIPAQLFIRRHMAEVVKCTSCGMDESRDAELSDIEKCHIRTAEVPAPMIPHSFVSPELLAHIIYEKYCNAVPLYRLEKDFKAKGVQLSRTTMANWIITAAQLWVKPIWERMHKELITSSVIHADETVVQVLNEPGKKAKTDSRMWVYCNGKVNDHSNILFEYQPTRNGDHAAKFLGDYNGYVVCDGFDGCNKLFVLERKYNGEDKKGNRIAEPLTAEQRHTERQTHSKAVLDEFFAWGEGLTVSGGTKLAKAVSYAKSEKKYLYRFLESGEIPIDNNRAENAVRPFCVGRKNWLFSASVNGAEASAVMYSAAATACANGMNVERYLTELFKTAAGTVILPW